MNEFKNAPQEIQQVIGAAMPIILSDKGFSRTEKEDLVYNVVLGSLAVLKYTEMLEVLENIELDLRKGYAIPAWILPKIQNIIKSTAEL